MTGAISSGVVESLLKIETLITEVELGKQKQIYLKGLLTNDVIFSYTFFALPLLPCHEKSRIRETKHLLTDAESSTITKQNPASKSKFIKNQTFVARRFYTIFEQKYSNLKQLLPITFPQGFGKSKNFGYWNSGSGDKKMFKWSEQRIKIL